MLLLLKIHLSPSTEQHKYAHMITTISHLQLITTLMQKGNNSCFRNLQFDFFWCYLQRIQQVFQNADTQRYFGILNGKNKDASIYPPIYLTLLLQRLKGCLPGFFSPWNMRMACAQKGKPDFINRGGRTVPLWMKITVKTCHFYDSCQRLRTWELKRTIIENKRTSKKLSLNKNLPVRKKKKKRNKQNHHAGHCPSGGCCVTISH